MRDNLTNTPLNKFGKAEPLGDQCENNTCTCVNHCEVDDEMMFYSGMYGQYKERMRAAQTRKKEEQIKLYEEEAPYSRNFKKYGNKNTDEVDKIADKNKIIETILKWVIQLIIALFILLFFFF